MRVKLRKAEPGAETFNNVPRYDLAAYELQKLFLDPAEYVVPPTALRMVPLAELRKYSPRREADLPRRRPGARRRAVLAAGRKVIADVYDPERFAADPVYARHIGQLNVLTYLIEHGDSNVGNFLISRAEAGRACFRSTMASRSPRSKATAASCGRTCGSTRLPADTVARLRAITRERAAARLAVLAQWKLQDGQFVAVPLGRQPLAAAAACGSEGDMLQMG